MVVAYSMLDVLTEQFRRQTAGEDTATGWKIILKLFPNLIH